MAELPSFLATTNRGLEDVAVRELRGLGIEAQAGVGRVYFHAGMREAVKLNLASRTLHRVVLVLLSSEVNSLEDIYRETRSIDFTQLIDRTQSFAVRADRVGEHGFTSLEAAAKVGQAIIDSYREACGCRLRVDLRNPDVIVKCLLRNEEMVLGIDLTGDSLHMRNYRVYDHPAALRTTIAASMVMLSGWRGEALLDPMCGGGTVLTEAALMARRVPPGVFRRDLAYRRLVFVDPRIEEEVAEELVKGASAGTYPIYGLDCSLKHVEGARRNAASAGVLDTVDVRVGDVFRLERYVKERPEFIITNPPYGIRSGPSLERMGGFYLKMLRGMRAAAKGSRALIITASKSKLIEAAGEEGVEVEGVRPVMHGSLQAYILTMKL